MKRTAAALGASARPTPRRPRFARGTAVWIAALAVGTVLAGVAVAEVPRPRPKPAAPAENAIVEAATLAGPESVPVPAPRPRVADAPATRGAERSAASIPTGVAEADLALPRAKPQPSAPRADAVALAPARTKGPDPEALRERHGACVAALKSLGVAFAPAPRSARARAARTARSSSRRSAASRSRHRRRFAARPPSPSPGGCARWWNRPRRATSGGA